MLRHSSRVGIGVYRINAFRSFTTSSKSNFPKVNINGVNLNYKIVGEGAHPVFCIPGLIGKFHKIEISLKNCRIDYNEEANVVNNFSPLLSQAPLIWITENFSVKLTRRNSNG